MKKNKNVQLKKSQFFILLSIFILKIVLLSKSFFSDKFIVYYSWIIL